MTHDESLRSLLKIVEGLDTRLDIVSKELDGNHVEWQRDRGIHIRLEAQVEALVSLLGELASRSGVSAEHVASCFRERFLYFQDRTLQETETASPDLAAHIDTRVSGEIPTHHSFQPLFPDEQNV
jgi:hypothetical protein